MRLAGLVAKEIGCKPTDLLDGDVESLYLNAMILNSAADADPSSLADEIRSKRARKRMYEY